jgi:hypothetical protein
VIQQSGTGIPDSVGPLAPLGVYDSPISQHAGSDVDVGDVMRSIGSEGVGSAPHNPMASLPPPVSLPPAAAASAIFVRPISQPPHGISNELKSAMTSHDTILSSPNGVRIAAWGVPTSPSPVASS